MPIRTTCPNCRTAYTLADNLAGKKVRCKNCDEVIAVRGAAPAREAEDRIQKGSSEAATSRIRSEEEPARPRRRTRDDDREPRPRKKGRSSASMMIGLGVGVFALVLVCGGIITAVVWWGRSAALNVTSLVDDLSGAWPEPMAGPMGRFPGGGMPGGESVTVHAAGVSDEFTREFVEDKLAALIDRGDSSSTASARAGDRMTMILAPVHDPKAFAARIDFATVRSVDGRLVTIIAKKVDGPPDNADSVTKSLFRLKSSSSHRRREAARKLIETLPDERRGQVASALEPLLSDADQNIRTTAIEALGVWGTPDTVPILLKAMQEKETRGAAIKALGRLKDARAVEPIAERLEDFFERGEAIEALKKIGTPAEDAMIQRLRHTNGDVRQAACDVLKVIGTKKSLPILEKVAAENDFFLSPKAKEAIKAIEMRQ
jgi:predicted Zn finger-like uncharacterized protein